MSVKSKMTAIANKIRTLLGITGAMGLDAMSDNLQTVQTEVNTQNDLIAQISTILETKMTGVVPSSTITITENDTYDVTKYASAEVNVPVGVFPSGQLSVTENGTHDVTEYAKVDVNVPVGVFPRDTLNITANGAYDVTDIAKANVQVPVGVFPSGTKNITVNGTYDVTNFVTAKVEVSNTIQIKRGSFVFRNENAPTIKCGFKPDLVYITNNEVSDPYVRGACVAFTAANNDYIMTAAGFKVGSYSSPPMINAIRYSDGFLIRNMVSIEDEIQVDYVAIKYT